MSLFSNLQIHRITESLLAKRQDGGQGYYRLCADAPSMLNRELLRTVTQRLTEYLRSNSHCVEMDIENDGEGSTFQMCAKMIACNDIEFIRLNRELVQRLESVQTSGKIPDGYVLVLSGTTGDEDKRFICVMKSELHEGFSTSAQLSDGSALVEQMQHIKQMFLTPTQKLYKIGIFVEETRPDGPEGELRFTDDFRAIIYDHHITRTSTDGMAQYFYKSFMGCTVAKISRKLTGDFYNLTQSHILNLSISDREKVEISTLLYSYLQDPVRSRINVADFAAYLPENFRGQYVNEMGEKEFPDIDIVIDRNVVAGKLSKRFLNFNSKVVITAPSTGFEDLLEVISNDEGYTLIKIRGFLTEKGDTTRPVNGSSHDAGRS